ncbi:MAG: hemolysin family protein [Candidatus Polarisedimenticolia bacterium]
MTPLDAAGGTGLLVSLILLAILAEAFFSGSEVAIVSADRARIRRRAEAGRAAARRLQAMMERPERVLSTTLIGTNLSVVAASFLANELFARRFGPQASWWAIPAVAPVILLFGEILPKTLARRHAETIALLAAWPLRAIMFVMTPAVAVMSGIARLVVRAFSKRVPRNPFVTKEELRHILQADHRLVLQKEEARLIRRLLDFADARARQPMTPLVDVVSISKDATVRDAARIIHERGFSRLPVHAGRPDNIVGIVQAMRLIEAPPERWDEPIAPGWMTQPFYVPESARIDRLLDEFRKQQQEMAIVVDEYGSAVGLLTLEDIVEEIVGDVLDEFDRPRKSGLERIDTGIVVADGKVRLEVVEKALDIILPREGYETVGGLAAHLFQKVPKAGETLDHEGLRITILEATQRHVRRVRIERLGEG